MQLYCILYSNTTWSHCGRCSHLSTHCYRNPPSSYYNHNTRFNRYNFPM